MDTDKHRSEKTPEAFGSWLAARKDMLVNLGVAVPTNPKFWQEHYEKYLATFPGPSV